MTARTHVADARRASLVSAVAGTDGGLVGGGGARRSNVAEQRLGQSLGGLAPPGEVGRCRRVGVGQVEYAVGALVDTTVVVLPPGARQLAADLRGTLKHRTLAAGGWEPPIVAASINQPCSPSGLSAEMDRQQDWARQTG